MRFLTPFTLKLIILVLIDTLKSDFAFVNFRGVIHIRNIYTSTPCYNLQRGVKNWVLGNPYFCTFKNFYL